VGCCSEKAVSSGFQPALGERFRPSNPVTGQLGYATFDAGYALFHGPSSKIGGFIGYNYFHENKAANGCTQIANNNAGCAPTIPSAILGITEDDRWDSLRVGLNAVVMVTDRLSLTGDAAYLPYAAFHEASFRTNPEVDRVCSLRES
jgi:hypothetical protein